MNDETDNDTLCTNGAAWRSSNQKKTFSSDTSCDFYQWAWR